MSNDQLSGLTTDLWPGAQHYVKAGKQYTACSRYSIYDEEKKQLIDRPSNKRKICKACLKSYNSKRSKNNEPIN